MTAENIILQARCMRKLKYSSKILESEFREVVDSIEWVE